MLILADRACFICLSNTLDLIQISCLGQKDMSSTGDNKSWVGVERHILARFLFQKSIKKYFFRCLVARLRREVEHINIFYAV